jgi:aerobic C4-dicarboxylate transport protein
VALLLGVDRIMDSMRVATNLLGNCVAAFAVSRWEDALDYGRAKSALNGESPFAPDPDAPVAPTEVPVRPQPVDVGGGSDGDRPPVEAN